jgi:hypothetical protein
MAIAYKSQGAGVSTETSGAALSPLCPAVVDAGDILVAHVFWESNVTAPSTPSGWTLLFGPSLIETSIARHWVFGKIAVGTEDGSAVAFGNPAVTTQRGARIYSFSGRISGTINELVRGFSETSHATDPAMPTVTTTEAGALAVALVAQNDNNAFVVPTGETGGDWVEAVAEYTVALTPGFSLGIETATPTANPGTITGGAMATTNDPCGVIGFEIRATAQVATNIETSTGLLSVTGLVPTVSIATIVSTGLASLIATGFIPTVVATANVNITTDLATGTFTGYEPIIVTGVNAVTRVGELIIMGLEPTVSVTNNTSVTIESGSLVLTGFSSNINITTNIPTGFGELQALSFVPTVNTTQNVNLTPINGVLTVIGLVPIIDISGSGINPGVGQLVTMGFVPTVIVEPRSHVRYWNGYYWKPLRLGN